MSNPLTPSGISLLHAITHDQKRKRKSINMRKQLGLSLENVGS
jgi:hypothetical protein